jgi:hypothetical protein
MSATILSDNAHIRTSALYLDYGVRIMNALIRPLLGGCFLLLVACSAGESPENHVWKAQTDALEEAREVEQMLQDAAEEKRRAMERQSQ